MSVFQLFLSVNSHLVRSADFSEPLNYFDPYPLSVLDFSESGLKIKQIIESVYTDGITGLDNIEVKGQNIVGTFSDYISPTLTNKFSFEITPDNVSYQLINPDAASYSEYLDFARVAKPKPVVDSALQTKADKSGRTRNCTTGKTMPCGARCQAIGKPCKGQPLAPELKQVQAEVADNFNKDLAKVKKENPAKKVSKVTQDRQADSKSPSVNESTPSTKKETIKKAVEPKGVAKSQETAKKETIKKAVEPKGVTKSQETAKKETIKEPAATSEKKDTLSTKALKLYDQNKEVTDAIYKQTEGKSGLYDTNAYGGGGEVDRLDIAGAALKQAAETGKIKGDAAVQSSYIENLLQHADRSITNDNSLRDKVTQQSMKSAELLYPLLSDEAKDQIAARDYDRFSLAQMTEITGKRNRNPYSMEIRKDLVNRIKGKIKSGEMVDLYDELSKTGS